MTEKTLSKVTILTLVTAMVFFGTMAAGSVFHPRQLAPSPVEGAMLQVSTGSANEMIWGTSIPTTACCDLDETYDAGNTIDFSGASTGADAVILHADHLNDPEYFWFGEFDSGAGYEFRHGVWTNGDFSFGATGGGGAAKRLLLGDRSAGCITVVSTEYLGDDDEVGDIRISDGSGNWSRWYTQALTGNLSWSMPASYAPGVGTYAIGDNDADGVLENILIPAAFSECLHGSHTLPTAFTSAAEVAYGGYVCQGSGTITAYGIYITRWIPDSTNVDTITVRLYKDEIPDASPLDSFTSVAGAAGYIESTGESLAFSADDLFIITCQITTLTLGPDTISAMAWKAEQ